MAKKVSFSCLKIDEFQRFRGQELLKKHFLDESEGREEFVSRAMPAIKQQVLDAIPYHGHTESCLFITKIRRSGYSDDDICRALARAWLDGTPEFSLPAIRKIDRLRTTGAIFMLSVVLTLCILIAYIFYLKGSHPDLVAGFLAFEPVLAAIAIVVMIPIFMLLSKILKK